MEEPEFAPIEILFDPEVSWLNTAKLLNTSEKSECPPIPMFLSPDIVTVLPRFGLCLATNAPISTFFFPEILL